MRFIGKSPSAARFSQSAKPARTSTILPLHGFGARIRQRLGLVTLPSCFLAAFGRPLSGLGLSGPAAPPKDPAAAPASGPLPLPGAKPPPGHGRPTAIFPGSAGPRTPAAGDISGIPVVHRKNSHQR